jgi:hypothetical protein
MFQTILWIGVIVLITISILEIWFPNTINEGFENLVSIGDSTFWAKFVPRRGDVGDGQEEAGYKRDDRYFHGYCDVQRLGQNQDYCRMVYREADPKDMFFACALGGTEGLSSLKYRTQSTREGFEISRDDYMNKVNDRDAYCRIIKIDDYSFEARCNESEDISFRKKTIVDPNPPKQIQLLLRAYQGIMWWYRLRDDIVDYAKNLITYKAGDLQIEEFPPLPKYEGARALQFNGLDQFMRVGDNSDMEFGEGNVELRYLRAVSFWVYFDEFTNNAHIFDFGNGAGKDNVWCGILGRGNSGAEDTPIRKLICGPEDDTMPDLPSGAQPVLVMSPQEAMKTTPGNVNDFTCPKPEIYGRIMPQTQPMSTPPGIAKSADLVYEIWDTQQRKFRIQVKNAIPLKKWVHIVITAENTDAFRPNIKIYRNGELYHTEADGWLPQNNFTSHNYIGKSNWADVTSQDENADELFKGKLFDFRGYRTIMTENRVKETYDWGKNLLKGQL